MSDLEAINLMKQGDINGLEGLVMRYQVKAVRAAFLISQDRALAEDIVQSAFLRAYEHIAQFDTSKPFSPWFLRIVVNDTLKAVKRSSRTISLDADPSGANSQMMQLAQDGLSAEEQLEEQLDRYATNEALALAMNQLPAEQRAALVMRYYIGLSDAEISARLDCTPGTVRWRLHRARGRLRHLLLPFSNGQPALGDYSRPKQPELQADSPNSLASDLKKGDN